MSKIIAHLDMDAFFASVEARYNPQFAGKAIVVGSDPKEGRGRGVVSTASYQARQFGIKSAMPISWAWRAAQEAKNSGLGEVVFLPPDFQLYEKSSANILKIIKKYCAIVQPASIDEFYFDLSEAASFKNATKICQKIKQDIKNEEKITCSIGLGQNKLIAKIAAGVKKPDGFFMVLPNESENFLEQLSISELPGIGPKTAGNLNKKGIYIVKDLKKFTLADLQKMLGKWGSAIYTKARGLDDSPVTENSPIKSIGQHNTFNTDSFDILFICTELEKSCQSVFERFEKSGFDGFKTITITVRFSDFKTVSSSKSFKVPIRAGDLKKFKFEVLKLLLPFLDKRKNPKLRKIRLVGVRIENLLK